MTDARDGSTILPRAAGRRRAGVLDLAVGGSGTGTAGAAAARGGGRAGRADRRRHRHQARAPAARARRAARARSQSIPFRAQGVCGAACATAGQPAGPHPSRWRRLARCHLRRLHRFHSGSSGILQPSDGPGRVAVLSDGRGNVFDGREGDVIEGRYRLLRVGNDSADLIYLDGRGRQTIRLSGQ